MTTFTSSRSGSPVIRRVAASPSRRGMRMSISTMSGRSSRTRRTASSPSAASPATSMSGCASSRARKPARTSSWSSASVTRITVSPRGLRRGPVGSVAVRCGERQFRQDPEAAIRAGSRPDRATEGGGPLPHSDQSVAAAARVVPGGGSRVVDAEPDAPGAVVDAHQCGAGAGVADDVGQGLLDDAEGGETGAGRDGGRIALALHGDGEPGGPRLFDQFGQPVEAGGRGRGGVAGCTEVGEHLTYLVERLLAGPLDRGEGGPGLFRVGIEQRESDPGLHVDDGDAVGQHVVEFAGHAQPFLVGPSPLRRLALRAGGRPLLTAHPQQFGGSHDGHDPCGDEALLCPGRGPVAVRRQPSVQPVGDQDMPGPQPAQRPPGGLPVPGDDRAEAADGDGDEHRAVRIARREIDQGHRAGAGHGDHGAAMAEEQHDDRDEQQQPRGQVQGPHGPARARRIRSRP